MTERKMKVEIWSDIMCPFCYIGKRHFESALKTFDNSGNIDIEWKSFQLDPTIPEDISADTTVYGYLAERKGVSVEQATQMHEGVMQMAQAAGLTYNFDIAKVANSMNAHRMIQMAKSKGLGDAAEEKLFQSYFTDGRNFGDTNEIVKMGLEIGLTEEEVMESLSNDDYAYKVKQDIQEGEKLGVRGVPFFVFDRKYGISGAQPIEAFSQTLEQSFAEWSKENPVQKLEIIDGQVCTTDGNCD